LNTAAGEPDPECNKDKKAESQQHFQGASGGQPNAILLSARNHIAPGLAGDENNSLITTIHEGAAGSVADGDKPDKNEDNVAENKINSSDSSVSKLIIDSCHENQQTVLICTDNLPDETDSTEIRKDVNVIVEFLVKSVESRFNNSSTGLAVVDVDSTLEPSAKIDMEDTGRMEVEESEYFTTVRNEEPSTSTARQSKDSDSTRVHGNEEPNEVRSISEQSAMSVDLDSKICKEGEHTKAVHSKHAFLPCAETIKVSWIPLSKASRQSRLVKKSSSLIGFDEDKINRVKMLLYTTGSQIHRGRGFERIFGMYWDTICLRLSSPLNINTSKRCDHAISEFLKSRKLRKIHNKFIMSIMRRAMRHRIPYTDVLEHIPLKWQDRVKVPKIIVSTKLSKKKSKPHFGGLKENFLQISSVPHVDKNVPYKEVWDIPDDATDEREQNPQEGPTEPIASSCIPGALVVDPFLRDTVEANGMKVTDSAMWLLTVALKEHIKNLLNDSIEHKKSLEKGEICPQAIHYPNVLASTSNKNKKTSKGKTSTAMQEIVRKKRINSIDLFAALNMLPSGQPSSIGGSISRMSLEQTFLSGFNSMQSFNAGNVFKAVQSFISSEITSMSKERKPEEKVKSSHTKSIENRTGASRKTKSTGCQEGSKKSRSSSLTKALEPTSSPIPTIESKALVTDVKTVVQTPIAGSNQRPGSAPATEPNMATPQIRNASRSGLNVSADGSQGIDEVEKDGSEVKVVKVTKPVEKVAIVSQPTQSGIQRSGAGRGAKNLAALMARAAEGNAQKESNVSSKGEENASAKNANATAENRFVTASTSAGRIASTSETPKSEITQRNAENPKHEVKTELTKETAESSKVSQSKPGSVAESGNREKTEGGSTYSPLPLPSRQTIAPIRRGKGKGFGSKDLAAMRARSMTTTNTANSGDDKLAGN